jgi:drug/metabolite transporter (DMT)-like permease
VSPAPSARSLGGVGLGILASAAFGSSGTFATSLLQNDWSPTAIVTLRVTIATLVLAIPGIVALRGRWYLLRRSARSILLFGFIGVAGCQVAYFQALQHLSVGVALLLEYMAILLVVAWQWARHGHRPRRLTVAGSTLAVAGLVFVLDVFGDVKLDPIGVLWAVSAAVCLAIYFFIADGVDEELPSVTMSGASMGVGAITLIVFAAFGLIPMHGNTKDVTLAGHQFSFLVPVLGISLLAAALAYVLSVAAVRSLGAKVSSFVSLAEILFAVLYAWLLLNQVPTWAQGVGGLLVIAGVALVRADEMRDEDAPNFAPEPLATLDE